VLFDNFVPLAELSRLCHSDAYHLDASLMKDLRVHIYWSDA